jgi:hypothetical protein
MTGRKYLMRDIRKAQPEWFSRENKRFFNDVEYAAFYGEATGNRYMVRSTYAWTDMFGSAKRLHYRINPIADDFKLLPLIGTEFATFADVQKWLKEN